MVKNYGPISPKVDRILHGADYNPDQWLDQPEVITQDYALMKLANCNVMSVSIFSWGALEPEEGVFTFEWLDEIMDGLYQNGVYTILATPSAARPAWLSHKYPEVQSMDERRVRRLHGGRQNHCLTSPIYRQKVNLINTLLAQRYKDHPGLIMWHVSNEYGHECHCPLCQEAFRTWLRKKYNNDLDALNKAWWAAFWGHTYRSWDEIESPSPIGERSIHGLELDWHRFVSAQTLDFYREECKPLKDITPDIPVTTNMHDYVHLQRGLNYWKFAPYVDVISWDNYPYWHTPEHPNYVEGAQRAFIHDMNRSFKHGRPFMLMESSPSATNWQKVGKLRRPGMQELASMQAVAHGADTVQYFQWRKGLGGFEKFHGAVVDHYPIPGTRVFQDVSRLGGELAKLGEVVGTSVQPDVAVVYDWENFWAIDGAIGPRAEKKDYFDACTRHYEALWNRGVATDVIDIGSDLTPYKLVVAPMLYMIPDGYGEKIQQFVDAGGVFVTTYWSGIANENDLCFTNGRPGPIREVMGIWSEEIDALYDGESNGVSGTCKEFPLGDYQAEIFCDLVHAEGAKVLAEYTTDFYAGYPAVTANQYGKGTAYYIAFRSYGSFLQDFYDEVMREHGIKPVLDIALPQGVTVQKREDERNVFYFLQNYDDAAHMVELPAEGFYDVLSETKVGQFVELPAYSYRVLKPVEE